MQHAAPVGITTALSVFFISLAFKANAIRSWLKRHTAKLHYPEEKLKRKKSSHFKEIDVYNEVEDSDKENIDEEDIRQDEDFDSGSSISHKSFSVTTETVLRLFTKIPGIRRLLKYESHKEQVEKDPVRPSPATAVFDPMLRFVRRRHQARRTTDIEARESSTSETSSMS